MPRPSLDAAPPTPADPPAAPAPSFAWPAPLPRPSQAELQAMALRLLGEELLTLAQAARLLPAEKGRRVHATTLARWHLEGRKGVRLDCMIGSGSSRLTGRPRPEARPVRFWRLFIGLLALALAAYGLQGVLAARARSPAARLAVQLALALLFLLVALGWLGLLVGRPVVIHR
jgi:hypothetical protein